MQVAEKVKEILADQALIAVQDVADDASLEDLGIDSMGVVEVIFGIEEAFDVQVPFNANEPQASDFDVSSVTAIVQAVQGLVDAK